eukprot:7110897-Prymnesium_polylepis.1
MSLDAQSVTKRRVIRSESCTFLHVRATPPPPRLRSSSHPSNDQQHTEKLLSLPRTIMQHASERQALPHIPSASNPPSII